MPSPIIHLQLNYVLSQSLNYKLSPEFILQSLAPDAIHMIEGSTWFDKSFTHFYDLADIDFKEAIQCAYEQTNSAGYCFHLYTDYLWREHIYTPFFQFYKDKLPRSELHALYYHDMAIIDQYYLQLADWTDDVKQRLLYAKVDSISILTDDAIKDWTIKICNQDLVEKIEGCQVEKLKVFQIVQVNQFIDTYLPIIIENLTQLGIELK